MAWTNVSVNNGTDTFRIPGSLSPQQVVNAYGNDIPNLSNMSATVTDQPNGDRTIVFTPRVGTKG